MRIAILGAGNLGLAQAGHLARAGHAVVLHNRSAERLGGLLRGEPLRLRGTTEGTAKVEGATTDLAAAVGDAEVIFVDVPASAHRELAAALQRALPNDSRAWLVLHPGQTFGARDFALHLQLSRFPGVTLAEVQTAIYTARATAPAEVTILALKRHVAFAIHGPRHGASPLAGLYPQLFEEPNTLVTALSNVQSFIHPAVCLANLARIERGESFRLYREGLTDAVGAIFDACDAERLALAHRLEVTVPTAAEWFGRGYGVLTDSALEAMRRIEAYQGILAPRGLDTRLLREDVPTGLAPLVELADALAVPAPNLTTLLERSRAVLGTHLTGERTLAALGLVGLDPPALRAAFADTLPGA